MMGFTKNFDLRTKHTNQSVYIFHVVTGEISCNGYMFNEFVPLKTWVYVSQYDQHISEMTEGN